MTGVVRFGAWRRLKFFGLGCFLLALAVLAGCGQSIGPVETSSSAKPPETTAMSTMPSQSQDQTSSSAAQTSVGAGEFLPVFETVAKKLAPLEVYGLRELPEGASLATEWWPVVEVTSPEEYGGERRANPWISAEEGGAASAEVVIRWGEGWLAVLENFRGDLGETPGEFVGEQGDAGAYRYQVNEGILVQWSREGRWYGVFGRQLEGGALADVALRMEIVPVK